MAAMMMYGKGLQGSCWHTRRIVDQLVVPGEELAVQSDEAGVEADKS